MRDLNDLYFFAQVVEHGGFAPAGRALGIPKSRLSRRIAALEERLGVRLIQRSTRRFAVTDVGQTFYAHARAAAAEAEAAEEAVARTRAEPQGLVRVSCPVMLAQGPLAPALARFLLDNPRVRVELESTNRRIDLIAEGIDVAIRVRQPPLEDSELIIKVFRRDSAVLVGARRCLEDRGRPQIPADLVAFNSLGMSRPGGDHWWRLIGPDGAVETVRHQPRLVTDDMQVLRRAALDGVGIVLLPRLLIQPDIDAGDLERLLPAWDTPEGLMHAVYPSRRGLVPAVRRFLDMLEETLPPYCPADA